MLALLQMGVTMMYYITRCGVVVGNESVNERDDLEDVPFAA